MSVTHATEPDGPMDDPNRASFAREITLELRVQELEAEVARLNSVVTSLKQSEMYWVGEAEKYSAEVAKWKAEAQWAARLIYDGTTKDENSERAQRILDGML